MIKQFNHNSPICYASLVSAIQIIIDTDPGIDDALALIYSYISGLPVSAITTVYGNADIEQVTTNAGYVLKGLGSGWPIHRGAKAPLIGTAQLAQSHGTSGLGDVIPKKDEVMAPSKLPALNQLISLPKDGSIVLFCLGPLTNIAAAFSANNSFGMCIKSLIVMGGAFTEKGNVTESAEFNAHNDPKALSDVIKFAKAHNIETTIIPVEICRKVTLSHDDLKLLETHSTLPRLAQIVKPFINYYTSDKQFGGFDGAVLYDVLVPVFYQHPEYFDTIPVDISVVQEIGEFYGQTKYVLEKESSIRLCSAIEGFKVKELIVSVLTNK